MNNRFAIGQRWISNAEPELGLGLVTELGHRTLTLTFRKSEENRIYALESAPISRISFNVGDKIHDLSNNEFTVTGSNLTDGIQEYTARAQDGSVQQLSEVLLADEIVLNQPFSRLLNTQFDHFSWFEIRRECLLALEYKYSHPWLGLCSSRTELLPHQLYIASQVSSRFAPRVLLADEVGLGKTIEACLILQQQLYTGLSSRVLILVPETLMHQWLVELLRRFNLYFSIFDADRCDEFIGEDINPFETEQLVLCSRDMLVSRMDIFDQLCNAQWDLLIVDEAHHMKSPGLNDEKSGNNDIISYQQVKALSEAIRGVLLLTATPDQLGEQSHFDLLHILDSGRFPEFKLFLQEQQLFLEIAAVIEEIEAISLETEQSRLSMLCNSLAEKFKEDDLTALLDQLSDPETTVTQKDQLRNRVIAAILDRHGTGRLQFRNTRKHVKGFPDRRLEAYPLDCPAEYQEVTLRNTPETGLDSSWQDYDPRLPWLITLLKSLVNKKVLLICAHRDTAIALEQHLRMRAGIRTSLFHEQMSIIERDRAAAYFADSEQGASILICSEIGSEGRNFQFSQHLVCFDLPLNPDLLEQRIGRLDRIGQQGEITIHIPYIKETLQEILFHWYEDGLNSIRQPNSAGFLVYQDLQDELQTFQTQQFLEAQPAISGFLARSHALNSKYQQELGEGRDRLLELNSFNEVEAQLLIETIKSYEQNESPYSFLMSLFDRLGLDTEENSDNTTIVQPTSDMVIESFPAVPDQGLTLTCDRKTALHREEVQFVTWHHPLISQGIDIVLQSDQGKASTGIIQQTGFCKGTVLLEALFNINVQAPAEFQHRRFLSTQMIRVLTDNNLTDLSQQISSQQIDENLQHLDIRHLQNVIAESRPLLRKMNKHNREIADLLLPDIIARANTKMLEDRNREINRLRALAKINNAVRVEELDYLELQIKGLHKAFNETSLELAAVRLIFAPR